MKAQAILTWDGSLVRGELTTDHNTSSYGIPVFVVGGEAYGSLEAIILSSSARVDDYARNAGYAVVRLAEDKSIPVADEPTPEQMQEL